MGLFDQPWQQAQTFLAEKRLRAEAREFWADRSAPWPTGDSLVLQDEAALELGRAAEGSAFFLMWSASESVTDGRISVIGPDLSEMQDLHFPLGLMLLIGVSPSDEDASFQEMKAAVYGTRLSGLMTRTLPSRQYLWCRVSREALTRGLSLTHWGAALIKGLRAMDFITGVEVIFVTAPGEDLARIKAIALTAGRIGGALLKMKEEKHFDCGNCEYWDVCAKVAELKAIRQKLIVQGKP